MSKSGKFKPNKGALKRLRRTAKGQFKRNRAGSQHLMSHKSGNARRGLRTPGIVATCEAKRLRRLLQTRVAKS